MFKFPRSKNIFLIQKANDNFLFLNPTKYKTQTSRWSRKINAQTRDSCKIIYYSICIPFISMTFAQFSPVMTTYLPTCKDMRISRHTSFSALFNIWFHFYWIKERILFYFDVIMSFYCNWCNLYGSQDVSIEFVIDIVCHFIILIYRKT